MHSFGWLGTGRTLVFVRTCYTAWWLPTPAFGRQKLMVGLAYNERPCLKDEKGELAQEGGFWSEFEPQKRTGHCKLSLWSIYMLHWLQWREFITVGSIQSTKHFIFWCAMQHCKRFSLTSIIGCWSIWLQGEHQKFEVKSWVPTVSEVRNCIKCGTRKV